MTDFNLELLGRVTEGFADVLHVERGHVMNLTLDECTCNEDAENAVVGMTMKAMERA